jgi:hypothetical protein
MGQCIQWGLPLLSGLLAFSLLERLQSVAVDPRHIPPEQGNAMPVYNVATGEKVADIPLVKFLRVSRRKFPSPAVGRP